MKCGLFIGKTENRVKKIKEANNTDKRSDHFEKVHRSNDFINIFSRCPFRVPKDDRFADS